MRTIGHSFAHGMFVREAEGNGAARGTIVYLHGLGESGLCFERIVLHPLLAAWRHLVPDLPGYGRSPWTQSPWSLAEHADHIVRWLEAHAPEPVILVGHSMGSVCGLLLCERHPERVRHFVNVEGNVTFGDCSYSRLAHAFAASDFEAHGFQSLLDRLYGEGQDDLPKRGYFASMRHCDPRVFHRNSGELVEVSMAETVPARVAALAVPVTHVSGVPGGNPQRTRTLLAQAGIRVVAIEPAGHWPFLDRPDDFAAIVARITADRDARG